MRLRGFKVFTAAFLIAATCGCQFLGTTPTDTNTGGPYLDDGNHMVVDKGGSSDFDGLQTENPSAYDSVSLPGEAAALSGTLLAAPTGLGDKVSNMAFRPNNGNGAATSAKTQPDEVRSVWISYLELQTMLTGKTEKQFQKNISAAFDNVSSYGLNTVIVHVRPFGDAIYESSYFPWSHIASGTQGKNPGYDPLKIMVSEAKQRGLRIEAWINPYRVRPQGSTEALSADNPARKWMEQGSDAVVNYNGVISYNPASTEAQDLIAKGVEELVKNYDVDGIHIDDYFYPTTDAAFDSTAYSAYTRAGGTLSLADWRRANVEALIQKMYKAAKSNGSSRVFGIAPQSNMNTNYNDQYLDVSKVVNNKGYCDYIMPQVYFGFQNDIQPYAKTVRSWQELVEGSHVKLYIGLGAYKCGGVDSWAGSGKNEWVQNTDLLARMVTEARTHSSYGGFALYRYDSIFAPASDRQSNIAKENKQLQALLK